MISFWILDRHDKKEGLYEIIEKNLYNRENKFSLKERFNMVMTVVTCFSWDDE